MTPQILDGRALAERIKADVRHRAHVVRSARGTAPGLRAVFIGENPPSRVYAQRLQRISHDVDIDFRVHHFGVGISVDELETELLALNADNSVDGVLVEMPLPPHLPATLVSEMLSPDKDVDGITTINAGQLYLGMHHHVPSCAAAMMELLHMSGTDPRGKDAVVVGRSNVVGKPVAFLLLSAGATVTVTHRGTPDLAIHTRQADILMVAAGAAGLIRGDMVKRGAVVIDAGINVTPTGIVGDVDFESVRLQASAVTPVPGGVGPVTNVVLLRGVVESAERRCAG